MVENSEIYFILCVLGVVAHSNAKVASLTAQECTNKYGAPSNEPSEFDVIRSVKYECSQSCFNPIYKQAKINEWNQRGLKVDEPNFDTTCSRAVKNTYNDRVLEQCQNKYSAPRTAPSYGEFDEMGRLTCALHCAYPERSKANLEHLGIDIDDTDTECKGFEIPKTNPVTIA